jgi:NodT family efflux transporter outer membrane factor (OMF) lipoprotein
MQADRSATTREREAEEVHGVTMDSMKHSSFSSSRAISGAMALACTMLALGACSVGPKYVAPEVSVDESWSEANDDRLEPDAPADSLWWQVFNDPTLDELIDLAHQQNLPLQIAALRIMESRAQLGIAVGRQYPQVQLAFGSATAVRVSEDAPNSFGLDREYWDFQLGFDAAWEADVWGKYRSDVEAEEATYFSSVADYEDALVSITAEVARTYAVVRTFEVLIQLAEDNVEIQEEGLRIADARFRNGATSELDVSQSQTLLESTRASIPRLQSGLQQSQNALATLLGQTRDDIEAMLAGSEGIPVAPAEVAVGVPAEMLRRRPDVRSAEWSAIAQCSRIGVAKADLYPSFSLLGTIGAQTTDGGGSLFESGNLFYAIGPRFLWPLFNWGRIKNNVRVQDARFQQLLVAYQDTVLRAAQEAEDAMAGYLRSQESLVFAQNAADAAQRSVDLAFLQYREGAVDYQRVLDAQRSLLEEQNSLAETRSSIATNLIALYKALGGGWEFQIGQPVVPEGMQEEMEDRTNWGDMLSEPPEEDSPNGTAP